MLKIKLLLLLKYSLIYTSPLKHSWPEKTSESKAEPRLFFGGGDEKEDTFGYGYYDYGYDPSFGPSGPPGPGHHFMDRDILDYDDDEEYQSDLASQFASFLSGLLNLQ